ncbi:MAG: NAD(P)-dependent oxidoreductase, partial [Pseudomonadota bacterium]
MTNINNIGFIGLGNVGFKLAGSLLRNGFNLWVHDLDKNLEQKFKKNGAQLAENPTLIAQKCDLVITCLPSPSASAAVLEGKNGLCEGLSKGSIWAEMSTTDEKEIKRLADIVSKTGASAVDCPVSGGCHRAATGNISIFAGCERAVFEKILPVLSKLVRRVLHTGYFGSASLLKVLKNYLATANLVSISEALTTAKAVGIDLNIAYEAIRISSGNSFVHETESQVILNGSRNINFTMELVDKDIGIFLDIARRAGLDLKMASLLVEMFKEAIKRYGPNEWSPNIIRCLEDDYNLKVLAPGFP